MSVNLQIACVGDVHLRQDAKRAQRLSSWDQIIANGVALPRLGAWLCLGDLFDAKSTPTDRNDAAIRLQAMGGVAPVVILRGNHDHEGEVSIFARLKAKYPITVVEHPDVVHLDTPYGPVSIGCVPYPFKAGLAAMGVAPADVMAAASGMLLDICRELRAELADAEHDGAAVLFAAHVNISGAVASSGQPVVGNEISLTREHLDLFDGMPRVAGHIHKAQEVHGAVYAGSIARMSFGEVEEKRALTVSLGPAPGQYSIASRPLDVPPMYHVDGQLTRDGFTWEVTRGPGGETLEAPASWAGSEVRVRFRFSQSEKSALNVDDVRLWFRRAARLELEPVAIPDRALRAPAVVAARTLAEKVQAWAEHVGVSTSEAVLAKLARLEQSDPQALVREVEGWLRETEQLEREAVAS